MPFPSVPTQVICPSCGAPFFVQVYTIVDVGEEPELKDKFLKGEINYARCPKCGTGGALNTTLLYHDPAKELLIVYVPSELGLSAEEQERVVGDLVKTVMNAQPAEKRKAYFLQPKVVLTLQSLYDTILEADGISKEVLDAYRARIKLANQFLSALDDEEALDKLVEEHREELTYEFFLLLADLIEGHKSAGDKEGAEKLESLRAKLTAKTQPSTPPPPPQGATRETNYEEIIDRLLEARGRDVWQPTVALLRPILDYQFFLVLTNKIEQAQKAGDEAEATKLSEFREELLQELDKLDKMVREADEKAAKLIMELSEAEDIEAAVREHAQEINQAFVEVLMAYRSVARSREDEELAKKLDAIWEATSKVIEESLPPEIRLIHKLIQAEHPEGTNAVLEEHRGLLNEDFLKVYDQYVQDLTRTGEHSLVEHLQKVREQIVVKMTILRP
ncbi:MAG: CpXC domain-containing protein [Anaerolineae bacterium]|nr:CpXC domain-containing protein [Anaerolineae bacterium]